MIRTFLAIILSMAAIFALFAFVEWFAEITEWMAPIFYVGVCGVLIYWSIRLALK